jgi:sugar lactone lactonase YvrE
MNADLQVDARATLGEGPSWHAAEQTLYWVDIIGQQLHRYDPETGDDDTWNLPETVGCAVPRKTGGLVVALKNSLAFFDTETVALETVAKVKNAHEAMRFNDGKCDPAGRFWAGTMNEHSHEPTGELYCLDTDLTLRTMETEITISNGLTWSPGATVMYYIDTPTQQVVAYNYDLDSGNISGKRVVIEVPKDIGFPDGMTIDREGMLWIAMWGGWKVTRWNPNSGELLETYDTPVRNTSSCCFGGAALQDLYITTARAGNSDDELATQPLAGGLFRLSTDVSGTEPYLFGG